MIILLHIHLNEPDNVEELQKSTSMSVQTEIELPSNDELNRLRQVNRLLMRKIYRLERRTTCVNIAGKEEFQHALQRIER